MSHKLMTLRSFNTVSEANIVRSQLEAEGIRVFLSGEEVAVMAWHLSSATGGIKLQVEESDAERAIAALDSDHSTTIAESDWQTDLIETEQFSDEDDEEVPSAINESLPRTFRSAIIGMFFFPLGIYAIFLLEKTLTQNKEPLSRKDKRLVLLTLLLSIPSVVMIMAIVASIPR